MMMSHVDIENKIHNFSYFNKPILELCSDSKKKENVSYLKYIKIIEMLYIIGIFRVCEIQIFCLHRFIHSPHS